MHSLVKSIIIASSLFAVSAASANEYLVTMNTEHQVWNDYVLPGNKVCLTFTSAQSGTPVSVKLRRTLNGEQRDLAINYGSRCLKMNSALGGMYVVYVTPVDGDTKVEVSSDAPTPTVRYNDTFEKSPRMGGPVR